MFTQAALLALTALTPLVNAHGWMHRVVIDGTEYPGPIPNNNDGQEFAIRAVNSVEPVKGADNPNLGCGPNAQKAALVADAAPGSTVGFGWVNGEQGPWVHNTGPVLTYMASCGDGSCKDFDSINAQWFKIDERGRKEDGAWVMSEYNQDRDSLLSVKLPSNLPAGEYLIRHELLAMHNGMAPGGAEFYPSCVQVRLSAPARADAKLPEGDSLTTFPGGYSDTDPGITDPNIFNPGSTYTFPGPNVVNDSELVGGGDDNSTGPDPATGGDGTPTSSSEESNPAPTEGSGCGGSRKFKKRVIKRIIRQEVRKIATPAKRKEAKREVHHPVRAISRVMRGIDLNNLN